MLQLLQGREKVYDGINALGVSNSMVGISVSMEQVSDNVVGLSAARDQ